MLPYPGILSIFAKSHSLLHNGHTDRVFNQRWIQSRWNTCPQQPNAMERPFSLFGDGLAWYSIDGSFNELRQMAHVSAQISQLHLVEKHEMRWWEICSNSKYRILHCKANLGTLASRQIESTREEEGSRNLTCILRSNCGSQIWLLGRLLPTPASRQVPCCQLLFLQPPWCSAF